MDNWPADIAVLVPVYNGGNCFKDFIASLLERVPVNNILIVDDGSQDDSVACAKKWRLSLIQHSRNKGKGGALKTGLKELSQKGFQYAVTMDADGQHLVEDLEGALELLKDQNYGLLIGNRNFRDPDMPKSRKFSNRTTTRIISYLCKQEILDSQSGYRIYGLKGITSLLPKTSRFEWESEVVIRIGLAGKKIGHWPIHTVYGEEISNISHVKDTLRFLRMVIKYWFKRFSK